jgi:hypothetical protein
MNAQQLLQTLAQRRIIRTSLVQIHVALFSRQLQRRAKQSHFPIG